MRPFKDKYQTYIEINGHEVEVEIEYRVSGDHIPATQFQPAESPELEIIAVWMERKDRDGIKHRIDLSLFAPSIIDDEMNELAEDEAGISLEARADAKADYLYELHRERKLGC